MKHAKTIMTVDDSASVRMMVNFALAELGCTVVEASDGEDALRKMEGQEIHMLITDLNMPGLDGIALIRRVRVNPAHRFVPIVVLTTVAQREKRLEAKAAGATGWMIKPFRPQELASVVRKLISE